MRIITVVVSFCVISIIAAASVCGISTAESGTNYNVLPDQAELFRVKHPDQAQFYYILAPISIEFMLVVELSRYSYVKSVIAGTKRRLGESGEAAEFLERRKNINERVFQEKKSAFESLGSRLKDTDRLFYFGYRRSGYGDFGVLVIRDGNIVVRQRHGHSFTPGADLPEESEVDFDRLEGSPIGQE